ncbi:MAG TPA: CvpA family protein [Gammaproteobacteria bacterium]|nr:CvpA family protein [Gammaproteobacteria bacterium]
MSGWTGLDFLIFLIFLINTMLGMARGGIKEMISMISLCAGLIVMIKFTVPLTKFLDGSPLMNDFLTSQFTLNFMKAIDMPPLTMNNLLAMDYCVSMLVCFVGAFCACEATLAFSSMMEAFGLTATIMNRKLGAALGATRGFVFALVFIVIVQRLFASDVPASNFINLLGGSAARMNSIILEKAPEKYIEILKDKDLYNQNEILKELPKPNW